MSDKSVYRTAPATPGLLISLAVSLRPAKTLLKRLRSTNLRKKEKKEKNRKKCTCF